MSDTAKITREERARARRAREARTPDGEPVPKRRRSRQRQQEPAQQARQPREKARKPREKARQPREKARDGGSRPARRDREQRVQRKQRPRPTPRKPIKAPRPVEAEAATEQTTGQTSRKKGIALAAAAAGAILLSVIVWAVAFRGGDQPTVDPAASPYATLQNRVAELEKQVKPKEILAALDAFLAEHPYGEYADKARAKRESTRDWLEMLAEQGGLEFIEQEKALRVYAKANPLAYPEIFSRLDGLAARFEQPAPQARLAKLRKTLRARFYRDARKVAGELHAQAKAQAGGGALAKAVATLDGYPKCFLETAPGRWLAEYRRELTDKIADGKSRAARTAYQALTRKIEALRKAGKLDRAIAACDGHDLPDTYFRQQLASLKKRLQAERSSRLAAQAKQAEQREKTREQARVTAALSRLPELIAAHRYQDAQALLTRTLAQTRQAALRERLQEEQRLIGRTTALIARIERAFRDGLRLKVRIGKGQPRTLVGMDARGFRCEPGDRQLAFADLQPADWSRLLFEAKAADTDPIAAARFLYRIKGIVEADRLLAGALNRQPSLRSKVHALLLAQGYQLPPSDFVYYQGSWVSGETHRHLVKGEIKVGNEWWTRKRLRAFLSGEKARTAAKTDPNSLVNLRKRRARYLEELGVLAVRTIADHGPANRRVDITIVSSGFTAREMANFRTTARQISDSLGRLDPWGYYYNYINVHVVEIADKQKADPFGGNLSKMRVPLSGFAGKDGYSTWSASPGAAWQYARLAPAADFVIVVANVSTGSASGDIHNKMATIHRQGSNRYDDEVNRRIGPYKGNLGEPGGDVATALAHVLGHAVGRLADEYEYRPTGSIKGHGSSSDDDFACNVTQQSDVRRSKWHYWTAQPIHAPGAVKSRMGAANSPTAWYRAQANCVMRGTSNRYCVVCREQMERTLLKYIRLVEEAAPAPQGTTLWRNERQTFSVRVFQPINPEGERHSRTAIEWFLDGKPLGGRKESRDAKFTVTLDGEALTPGTHELVARVSLISPYMRRDMGRSTDIVAWTFEVADTRKPDLIVPASRRAQSRGFIRFAVRADDLPEGFRLTADHLPAGASFDPATRIFSWRPSPEQHGVFAVRFGATDGKRSVHRTTELFVRGPRANHAPVCDYVPSIQLQAGTHLKVQLSATDIDGDRLRYGLVGDLDPRLRIHLNQTTGELRWFVPHNVQGNLELVWEVTDGVKSSRSKLLMIVNQGQLKADSHFPDHEVGLGLWCEAREIRQATMARLSAQPVSFQVFQLVRLLRDVNGKVRGQASAALQRLLASSDQSKVRIVAVLLLHAESSKLDQHCVTPGAWGTVSGLLAQVAGHQQLPAGVKQRAAELQAKLAKIQKEHSGL